MPSAKNTSQQRRTARIRPTFTNAEAQSREALAAVVGHDDERVAFLAQQIVFDGLTPAQTEAAWRHLLKS